MIILEGTDAVGKTTTIEELKKEGIFCEDRSKDMISKYMLEEYTTPYRAKKYQEYLKTHDCLILFLINNDAEELMRRVLQRKEISAFDQEAPKYNRLYEETYLYMAKEGMLENKLYLIDTTGLSKKEQVQKVKEKILEKKK